MLKTPEFITLEQLQEIFPNCPQDKAVLYAAAFNAVWPKYGVSLNPRRMAAFLGQIGVESGELRYDKELPSKYNKENPHDPAELVGTKYCNRKATLGNYVCTLASTGKHNGQVCHGILYAGKGILQLTGYANYNSIGQKIGFNLVKNPQLACDPLVGTHIACQFFVDRGLLAQADVWKLDRITQLVNGKAMLHHRQRIDYSEKALKVLTPKKEEPHVA